MNHNADLRAPSLSLRHKARYEILVLAGLRQWILQLRVIVNLGLDQLHVEVADVGEDVVLHAGEVRLH